VRFNRALAVALAIFVVSSPCCAQSPAPEPTPATIGELLDGALSQQAKLIADMRAELDAIKDSLPMLSWDDYGAREGDPTFDNGPILTAMLSDVAHRKITRAPVGLLGDYYVSSTIEWPKWAGGVLAGGGGYTYAYSIPDIGVTRIVWNGPKGGTMLRYQGSGGRIERLQLCGGPLNDNSYPAVAGTGVEVPANLEPPCGNLVTDQLAIVQCDVGLHYLATPDNNHADQQKHYSLLFHKVRLPYWVEGEQSCPHDLFSVDIRDGWETAFKFDRGGGLHVYGCYIGGNGSGNLQTLLAITRANDSNGYFAIQGLQQDGSVNNLKLVDAGKYGGNVDIEGHTIWGKLANPYVTLAAGDQFSHVKVGCWNSPWPIPAPTPVPIPTPATK